MITNREELDVTLQQLASFKGLLEPTLIPLAATNQVHWIWDLQAEVCDYLLEKQAKERILQ